MKKVLLVLVLTVMFACEGKEDREVNCETVLCATDQFIITFRDLSGVPLLGTQFVKDSFKLSSTNSIRYIKPIPFGEIDNLAIFYEDVESDLKYTLELSPTEIDTLRFIFSTKVGSCCTISTMQELSYNGVLSFSEEDNLYVLIRE